MFERLNPGFKKPGVGTRIGNPQFWGARDRWSPGAHLTTTVAHSASSWPCEGPCLKQKGDGT